MKRFLPFIALVGIGLAIILVFYKPIPPAVNPDPNHTHADFLVMIDGTPIDFSGPEFMSAEPGTGTGVARDISHGPLGEYLHMHDGNGHVIHRHKPGLTLADFFTAINVGFTANCLIYKAPLDKDMVCSKNPFRMVVNDQERPFSLDYDFADGDKIMLSTAPDDASLKADWSHITDDACRYSRTCPWKGPPPTENCIADPTVPCRIVN